MGGGGGVSPKAGGGGAAAPLSPRTPLLSPPTSSSTTGLEIASPFGPQLLAGFLNEDIEEGEDDLLGFYASGIGLDDFDVEEGVEGLGGGRVLQMENFQLVARLWGE